MYCLRKKVENSNPPYFHMKHFQNVESLKKSLKNGGLLASKPYVKDFSLTQFLQDVRRC